MSGSQTPSFRSAFCGCPSPTLGTGVVEMIAKTVRTKYLLIKWSTVRSRPGSPNTSNKSDHITPRPHLRPAAGSQFLSHGSQFPFRSCSRIWMKGR